MMKKIALFTLCVILPIINKGAGEEEKLSPIVINSNVLRFIDGTPFVKISHLVHFALQVRVFRRGPKSNAQEAMNIKKINHKNTLYTLQELLAYQEQHPHDNYSAALREAIEIFEEITIPYLENARGSEEYMIKLIHDWSKQRNKPNTYLLTWSQANRNEHEVFVRHMTSLKRLDEFCNDLEIFLTDFMNTCKKSWKQYKHMREEQQHTKK